ncbi:MULTISPECIES: hypothetical protein [unclassified Yoonia]|uniref:hypothetical protein n=1 Tax=unclassified Yoonia TaxID=2629118 RepID=UPI002AFEDDD1|nr:MULTISPECIES: hypothetical protein [unclassified Yoonia]
MSRRKSPVSQADLTRWVKAVRAAGGTELRVEIAQPDGTQVVIIAGQQSSVEVQNPCDRLLKQ